jgi:hypothetical protein
MLLEFFKKGFDILNFVLCAYFVFIVLYLEFVWSLYLGSWDFWLRLVRARLMNMPLLLVSLTNCPTGHITFNLCPSAVQIHMHNSNCICF